MGAFFSVTALARALRPDEEQQLIKRQFKRKPGTAWFGLTAWLHARRAAACLQIELPCLYPPHMHAGLYLGSKRQRAYEAVRCLAGPSPPLAGGAAAGGREAEWPPPPCWVDISVSCSGLPRADIFR